MVVSGKWLHLITSRMMTEREEKVPTRAWLGQCYRDEKNTTNKSSLLYHLLFQLIEI